MHNVVFVCHHGGAKSLIAAEYFSRFAAERGLPLRGVSAGVDPYAEVPPPVIAGLAAKGIDVSGFTPQPLNPDTFAAAERVIHFGCDAGPLVDSGMSVDDWSDVPDVSDGFERAHDLIRQRVERLVQMIAERGSETR